MSKESKSNFDKETSVASKTKEVKPKEVKPKEVKPTEVKTKEVKPKEVKPTEVKTKEVKPKKVKTKEVKPKEVKTKEVKPKEVKPKKVKTNNENISKLNFKKDIKTFTSDILNIKKINTLDRLTIYEKTQIIGERATQIQNGMSPILIKEGKHIEFPDSWNTKTCIELAHCELKNGSCPLIIERKLPSGKILNIPVQELY
jgi:DNA-directed RNA polymerase subunit K/omega